MFTLFSCNKFTTWDTPKGGDFKLQTPSGELNTKDLRGKYLFIFFGFLNCPHVCPTTIRELSQMMNGLTPTERQKVVPIFVSVDPERDTLPAMKEHFKKFDPAFISATGTVEEVRSVLKQFGGDFKVFKGKDPTDVAIDHTSTVFVINRKGVWVNSLPYDSTAQEFKHAFDIAYAQKPYWSEEARSERIKILGTNESCDLSKTNCEFVTDDGIKFEAELSPRPAMHLKKTQLRLRTKTHKLTPKVADFVGVELAMGLIRPKLVKTNDDTWVAGFTLPTCDLGKMNWKLRLLLQDSKKDNHEIQFRFSSINLNPTERAH